VDVPEINQSLLYAAFTTMAGATLARSVEKFGEALQNYEHQRAPTMERFCRVLGRSSTRTSVPGTRQR